MRNLRRMLLDERNKKIKKYETKKVLLPCAVILFLTVGLAVWLFVSRSRANANGAITLPINMESVVEWDVVSPSDVNIPKLSKIQLLSEIEKSIKMQQAIDSWEAKYNVTHRQSPRKSGDMEVPEALTSLKIRTISNRSKWLYEKKKETEDKSDSHTCFVSNGEIISIVMPNSKQGQVQKANQGVPVWYPTLTNFLPSLPSESLTKERSFPEVLDIIEASDAKLLPWYTRVDNQICYVLEQKTTLRHPLFRNKEEVENWKKANPKEAEAWSKAGRQGLVILINLDPRAKPGETREIETKIRIAIAPQLDFAIVRWAYGWEINTGNIQGRLFPKNEIKYSDFHKINKELFIPRQMALTRYIFGQQGQRQITHETELLLEEFVVNKQYNPELFEVHFPVGYSIVDSERGISYIVGDSEEKIDALTTAAKSRDNFYNKLRSEEAPDLEYSEWINSKPILLADHKGRPIILHFWGIACGPCMHELPQLQKQYGHVLKNTSSPLFISVHPFADGNELRQLKKTIEKHGITFPVMVDAPDLEGRSWGKTFKRYMVFGIPSEVKIDKKGHFAENDQIYISPGSRWMNDLED